MSKVLKNVLQSSDITLRRVTTIPLNIFTMSGTVHINLWSGNSGTTVMHDVLIESELTLDVIKENINDGGFGCESIISANVFITQTVDEIIEVLNEDLTVIETYKNVIHKDIINNKYIKLKG